MLNNKKLIIYVFLLSFGVIVSPLYAKKIEGDPDVIWQSPLDDGDIKDNAYNRCLLIRKMKPGADKLETATQGTYEMFTLYATSLYAQAIKISSYLELEKENADTGGSDADLSNEVELLNNEITKRLGDISRRINIINSLEAGVVILDSLNKIATLPPNAYETFRVFKNGVMDYSGDCEDLK